MQGTKQQYIGVFDSGFGGIDILREIVRHLPQYHYVYLGDTARTPYGTRSADVVYSFTIQAIEALIRKGCSLIILACNTASSDALRRIQQEYIPQHHPEVKVLGVLIPAAEAAVAETTSKRIGVLATEGTVQSHSFVRELTKLDPEVVVWQQAAPLLVPFVEAGEHNTPEIRSIIRRYVTPLLDENIDTLILGCTHYGILERTIRDIAGPDINIISEAQILPDKLADYLQRHHTREQALTRDGTVEFFSTDLTPTFTRLGSLFYGAPVAAKHINLTAL